MNREVLLTADHFPLVRDVGWFRVDARYAHPDRIVEYEVFLFVVRGRMQVVEEGVEYWVGENEHLFLKSGLHHWGDPVTEPGTEWYWIHFVTPLEPSQHYRAYSPLPEFEHCLPDHYRYLIPLPKNGTSPFHTGLAARLHALVAECRTRGEDYMTYVSLHVCELLLKLRQAMTAGERRGQSGKAGSITSRVMSYLLLHADENFDSVKLAEHMRLNYSYLSAVFKRQTGQTIVKTHTRLRMGKAVELMRSSSLNISEISERLGYHNPYYFSSVFKSVFGEAPSSYLRHFYRT